MNLLRENQMLINATRKGIFPVRNIDDDDPEKAMSGTPTTLSIVLGISPKRSTQGKKIKILSPKQVLQRLPIAIAQVQARNTSANLLNKISHFFYSLRQTNFSKELYNDLINSVYI